MEDRRSKVEEENRHITELLEQADRKQFRLELEVDKLRDKVRNMLEKNILFFYVFFFEILNPVKLLNV
jgi:hypothetical protein